MFSRLVLGYALNLTIGDAWYEISQSNLSNINMDKQGYNSSLYYSCLYTKCKFKYNGSLLQGIYTANNNVYRLRTVDGDVVIDNYSSLYASIVPAVGLDQYSCNIQIYTDGTFDIFELINLLSLSSASLNIQYSPYSVNITPLANTTLSVLITSNISLINSQFIPTYSSADIYLASLNILSLIQPSQCQLMALSRTSASATTTLLPTVTSALNWSPLLYLASKTVTASSQYSIASTNIVKSTNIKSANFSATTMSELSSNLLLTSIKSTATLMSNTVTSRTSKTTEIEATKMPIVSSSVTITLSSVPIISKSNSEVASITTASQNMTANYTSQFATINLNGSNSSNLLAIGEFSTYLNSSAQYVQLRKQELKLNQSSYFSTVLNDFVGTSVSSKFNSITYNCVLPMILYL